MLLMIVIGTLLSRLLQDSECLASGGCGYGSGLPSGALKMDHTVIAGAEVGTPV